jgi:hypothetical protein
MVGRDLLSWSGADGSTDWGERLCEPAWYPPGGRAATGDRTKWHRAAYDLRVIRRPATVLLSLMVAGCGGPGSSTISRVSPVATSVPSGVSSPDAGTAGGVAADVERLLDALDGVHPNAYHGISREDFVAALDAYVADLPNLSPEESIVELMRVTALLSRDGRDGHQFALPQPGHEGPALPIRVYEFEEGLVVTAAAPPNADLVGATITAVEAVPIDEVLSRIEPLVPRDGPDTVLAFRPIFLVRTEVLRGLGIVDGDGRVEVTYDHHGSEATATLEPMAFDAYVDWLGDGTPHRLPAVDRLAYLAQPEPLTVRGLDGGVLYIRYRNVVRPDVTAAQALLDAGGIRRLVLDLRQNPGGDNTQYGPLLTFVREFAADHPGQLRVLIDRVTFSAASNLATEIERWTDAVFIGEPMAGGLNFWDDVTQVRMDALPVPMQIGVSTRYWEFAEADDPRLTIKPDVLVPASSDDFLAGRDPVLAAAVDG